MKRTNLRRAVSGVLSVAMTASALFSDFSVPTNAFASEDTSVSSESSLDVYSDGSGSITSEYIAANLDEDLGNEAAALNEDAAYTVAEEYLLSTVSGNDVESVTESEDGTDNEVSEDSEVSTDSAESEDSSGDEVNSITIESDDTISASGNDADTVGVSSNDAGIVTLNLDDASDVETVETEVSVTETEEDVSSDIETEVTVSEEEIATLAEEILDSTADIETVDDYDTNGLATVYHYILLNVTLVDSDYVWDGMTISDVWSQVPESFIASYLTTINVYTLEDNEDYYVALVDPTTLNGLGSAIYADFTNLDTENPTVYNDIITFDVDTGLIYIPKSFYYDENGEEVTKELEAQVLIPYSMNQEESSISVSVTSEMDGVDGISGTYSVPTLDVTTTFQIVDVSVADKISLDDICISVNDDVLPYDTSDGNALYDTETGELTISASPNTVYSVSVVISEDVSATEESDETLAFLGQRELLIASASDDLSGLLMADNSNETPYSDPTTSTTYAYEATSVANMNAVNGVKVTLTSDAGTLVAGQQFVYAAHWATNLSSEASIVEAVIAETAQYSYYAWDSNPMLQDDGTYHATYIDDDNYSDIIFSSDSAGTISYSSSGTIKHLYRAASGSSYHYAYNRMVSLPNNQSLTSTDGKATTSWTAKCFSGNSSYSNYIAVHCTEIINDVAHGYSGTDNITIRVLYVSSDYMVFSLSVPLSYTQAGSGVFKVELDGNDKDYYARFGVKKVDEETGDSLSGATFAYYVTNYVDFDDIETFSKTTSKVATSYTSGSITGTQLLAAFNTNGFSATGTIVASSGVNYVTLDSDTCSALADYGSNGFVWVYITEVAAPDGYVRSNTVWCLGITVSTTGYSSSITSTYFYECDDNGNITGSASPTYNKDYAWIEADNTPLDTYGALNLVKTSTSSSSTYVGGAVYALIETGAGISYSNYVTMATEAYEANKTDSAAAFKAFYEAMQDYSGGDLSGYIVGAYKTNSSSTSAEIKSVSSTGTISSTSTVLDFGTSSQKKYVLVEVWTPTGYTLDDSYYAFYLKSNGNTSQTYSDAVEKTTMITSTSDSTTAPLHQKTGSTATSANTWSTYASTAGNYKGATLQLKLKDETATYYGAMNLSKLSDDGSTVSGAVYALIETGAGISYGTASELKKVTTSGTISSTSTVLDFGTKSQKKYVLVEVWTPTGYTLDSSYYAFYLQNNKNESSTYSTAVSNTTMITDDSDATYAPIHQTTGGTATSSNTWDDYATVTNASSLTLAVLLGVSDDEATYYGAMNLSKKARVEGQYVKDAVYVLIETGAGISYYNYVNMATAAYEDNTTDSAAAMKAFYNSMKNYSGGDLTEYIVGAYTTTASIATLKAVNSDGTISSDNTVLNFGNKAQKKYVLVEVWTPSDYALDDSYFAFYLQSNKNESDDYDTAVNNTTMITDTSSTTTTPIHQVTGGTVTSANTWDMYATVANGSNLIAPLRLTAGNDELISHTVTKSLDSDLTESLVVSVTMELYADGDATGMTVTLDNDNDWTYTWEGLYKYDLNDDHEIEYTVKETSVEIMDDYDRTSISTVETSNVNTVFTVDIDELGGETRIGDTVKTTYLNVEKDFGIDTENVKEVIVELYRNNDPTGVKLTLNSDNNWEDTFENLVEYDPNGKAYSYKAVEVSVTYTDMWGIDRTITDRNIIKTVFTVTEVTSGKTTTITDTFNRVDHTVTKEMEGLTETLVTSVTMELFANNASLESVFGNIVLSDSNSWTGTWEGLDEYDYKGNLITYTVDEIEVTMADQFHTAVINTVPESSVKTVFDVDIEELGGETEVDNDVVITYLDVEKKFGTNTKDRISKVVVTLYRNDEAQPYTITLSDSNNWKGTFEKLVKYDPNGVEYEYRAVETSVTYTDMWGVEYTVTDRTAIENLFAVEEVTANYKTTVTNTFQFTERTVDKLFDDYTATRLVQITARIYADGVSAYSLFGDKILNEDNNWTELWDGTSKDGTTWIGLDKYDHNGNLIKYTVEETEVIYTDKDNPTDTQHIVSHGVLITIFEPVYDDEVDETTSSITNTLQTVDLTVVKEWGEYTKSHLVSIQVELWENNNPTGKIVTLSDANNWTYTWEKLDKYDSIARAYKYEAKEISVTYTDMWGDEYTVTPSDLMFVLFDVETETEDGVTTIKNTYATTEYTVSKTFGSTLTESLVTSVTAMLTADGKDAESAFANLVLTEDNSWTSTWYGIDMYDHEGNVIEYGAKEVSLTMKDQYDATVISTVKNALETVFDVVITPKEGETVIDNTVVTTEHTVVKKFGENTDGRITEVEVTLYRNGKAMPATLTLNEANGWTNTFTDLVKYDPDGNEYKYSAVETKVTYNDMWGTSHTITDEKIINTVFDVDAVTADNTTTITNTIVVTEHNVVKTFGSDLTESLVESIVAELFANKVSLETVFGNKTLTKATDWSATWEKLDKYDYNGILYSYTSEEVSVDMEDQFDATVVSTVKDALNTVFTVITSTKNGTTTVDNTVNITHLDVEKVFGDKTEQRIKEVVVTLYRNGEAKPYTLTLNAENNWSDTFENLVKYDPDGNEYVYTAVETSVTYYDMWGDEYTVTDPDVMDKLFNVKAVTENGKTTITNTFEYTERAVTKAFATDLAEKRIQAITTTLYATVRFG